MTQPRDTNALAERRNVSLPPVLSRAADALAVQEGRKFSQLIQEMIRERAARTFGPDWSRRFLDEEAA